MYCTLYCTIWDIFIFQGPGKLYVLSPSSTARNIKFSFPRETVITGVIITTHLNFSLHTFTVREAIKVEKIKKRDK